MTRSDPPSRRDRDRRPQGPGRWKVIGAIVALVVVVGGLTAVAYLTPLMSVRSIEVTGAAAVDDAEILRVAAVPEGAPLLRVDTSAIADRVSVLPAVESVNVSLGYPSTVTIEVTERTPVVKLERDGKIGVMDRLGMVYLTFESVKAMPKDLQVLPDLVMDDPGASNPTTQAALTVVQDLPDWLRSRTTEVSADSPSGIRLKLKSGRIAVWGDSDRTADKAEALRHLLSVKGTEYNVSSPEYTSVS